MSEAPKPRAPVVAARAILIHRDHVLLLRAEDPGRVWYFLPGGTVRHGETLERACAREVLEETGLQVRVLRPLYMREFIASRHRRRSSHMPEAHHVIGILFRCELNADDATKAPQQLGEFLADAGSTGVTGIEWVPLARVPEIEIMPPHVRQALMGRFPPPPDAGIQFWLEE